jgi:8-oxo-dGTP pyrophosphatase MutT (NUDIX family)
MPGLWVFPGGKVEATDPGTGELEQARHAAARELQEESGITLDPEVLQPFSHWLTPVVVSRRFATWFFLGDVAGDQLVQVDGSEIVEHQWLAPSSAVALHHAGDLPMTPPTLVSLHVIEHAADVASLSAAMQHRSVQRFFPNVVREDERMVFLYEGDAAYESGNLGDQGPVHRTTGERGIFHYHVAG